MEATKKAFSIDFEPKTLNSDQIQQAREAALYLLKTKSSEEAVKIFTQTSEKSQENFIEGVNSELQETEGKKTDAIGADDTNLVQEVENEKMEEIVSDDDVDFEEESDGSSGDDDSLLPTLVIDPERTIYSAPF